VLSKQAQKRVKDAVWSLERIGSVSDLMALMEADIRKADRTKAKITVRSRKKASKSSKISLA
jgi:hypothetical protein